MHIITASLACVCLIGAPSGDASLPDLSKIERSIAQEPSYTCEQPLYGLVVFGPKANVPVWMVLDKSGSDVERYDVLYADLNSNGDLTEPEEKFTSEGEDVRIHLPDFKDTASGAVHTELYVRSAKDEPREVMVRLKWRGKRLMGGGYPEDPSDGYLKFAEKSASAPILWANGDGPFRFQRWYGGQLKIGVADDQNDLKLFVGQQGREENSFWAFTEHFLPEEEGLKATLIYNDVTDKEQRHVSMLKERC